MTENSKQELTQLLHEALVNLEIRLDSANKYKLPPIISVNEYSQILLQCWKYHSIDFLSPVRFYEPHIVNATTKSELLDFIRVEFASFIHEDKIQSAIFFIVGGPVSGYPLEDLLKQLLKIAIVFGVEKAISDFDKCTENRSGSFQYRAILEGISVGEEMKVFEGMRLVPLPQSTSELPRYLPPTFEMHSGASDFLGKTLFVINASVSPIFCKPSPDVLREGFQVEVTGGKFPNFKEYDFHEKFCQALSLVCNSAVGTSLQWLFLGDHEIFNLSPLEVSGMSWRPGADRYGSSTAAGETQIEEAKRRYKVLIKLDSKVREKLQIPIDRWIKSKTSQTAVDKIIDLGIALEALYLSETDYNREIRFRFGLHAAWYLGKNKEHREELMKEFKTIYDWRSTVVHTGKLSKKARNVAPEEVEAFITNAQNFCRDSIMKILEDGKFPDWNDLILGEDSL